MYQNIATDNGRSTFAQVEPNGQLSELQFTGKRASVPMGSGYRVTTANQTVVLTRRVNIAPEGEVPVYFPRTVKISINDQSGQTASITEMLTDILAFLATARTSYNADNGLVPPASASFTEPV